MQEHHHREAEETLTLRSWYNSRRLSEIKHICNKPRLWRAATHGAESGFVVEGSMPPETLLSLLTTENRTLTMKRLVFFLHHIAVH